MCIRDSLASGGLVATGVSPDGQLVEIVEYEDHPFMAGTQFHPEFLSGPTRPHPMFREFIRVVSNGAVKTPNGANSTTNGGNGKDSLGLERDTNSKALYGSHSASTTDA